MLRWAPLAAAASVGLAFVLVPTRGLRPVSPPAAPGPQVAMAPRDPTGGQDPRDLNGDGRLDILDALVLARSIESATIIPGRDFDGDGVVTSADVDALAAAVVKLNPEISGVPRETLGRSLGRVSITGDAAQRWMRGAPL